MLSISRQTLFRVLFICCIGVPYLNNYELTFLVWGLTASLTLERFYSISFIVQVACYGIILMLSFLPSFYNDFKWYDYIRDITYLIKPIFGLFVGYQICRKYNKNPIELVFFTGVLLASIHLLIVCYGYFYKGYSNIHEIRAFAGFFSDYEVYVIIIGLFHNHFGITLSKKFKTIYLSILITSSVFYLSRTNIIQFFILYIALKGYFEFNKRNLIGLLSILLSVGFIYSAVLYYNPKRNGKGVEAFLYKIKIAPTEPFKSKIDVEDYKDFNDNYRSVENINTREQMSKDGVVNMLFGKGLGSKIDLKQEVWLDNVELRYISILHNGFMTTYLKSGLVGVFFLLVSIALFFKKFDTKSEINKNINNLMIGTGLFLFISYWVFMGFYFKADTKSILLGLLIAFAEKQTRNFSNFNSKVSLE